MEVFEFYNSENALVIVAAMKKLYASRLTKCLADWSEFRIQVDCLGHGNVGKTMTKAEIYHVKEPTSWEESHGCENSLYAEWVVNLGL